MYEETYFGIGIFLQCCAVVVFLPLLPAIVELFFHYSRAAHFSIISDIRFILTVVLGIVAISFTVLPSVGGE